MKVPLLGICVALSMAGCNSPDPRIDDLKKEIIDLKIEKESLESRIKSIERKQYLDDLFSKMNDIAYLTPESEGYSVIQMDLGRLTVGIDDIKPYANGSRIVLKIGNTLNARINGAKATLEWGSMKPEGGPENEEVKSREFTFVESLEAGSWTKVPIILGGVKPSELGFVRVKEMTHTGISLSR